MPESPTCGVPELPEVETIRRNCDRKLVGHRPVSIQVSLEKLFRDSPLPDLQLIVGRRVLAARRRAKVLILDFEDALSLMVHFKLSGQFAIIARDGSRYVAGHPVPDPLGLYPHKTSHIRFEFDDGTVAYYSDIRQFGWLRLMPSEDVPSMVATMKFGPEATDLTEHHSALVAIMKRRGVPIKTLLLDQTVLAGLGNIYADEVLFRSSVHPATAANALSGPARKRILAEIPPVIAEGIRQGGAKIIQNKAHPVDNFPAVHGREGEPCDVCGTRILKIRVGARGTYFCPRCQRPPRIRKPALIGRVNDLASGE